MKVPSTARQVMRATGKYYIDTDGTVYAFPISHPQGIKSKFRLSTAGYVSTTIDGKSVDVHVLMAETFIMQDYIKKGLCCLHRDNDKTNCNISNLNIGTYSQNNKDAVTDKLKQSTKGCGKHGKLSRVRFDWDKVDLVALIAKYRGINLRIAKEIGCSGNSVKNRRKKVGL